MLNKLNSKIKRKVQVLSLFIFLFVSGITTIKSQAPDGWLYTQGNKIYKSDGTVFAGAGVNIFDRRINGDMSEPITVDEIKNHIDIVVDEWGADFLRLCLAFEDYNDPIVDPDYLNEIDEIVEYIGTKPGVYVLVSDWWDYTVRGDADRIPLEATMPMLKAITKKLAKYPHVLFGVSNEPQGDGSQADNEKAWNAMSMAVDSVRAAETEAGSVYQHIITVQGLQSYGKHLGYYVTHPITAGGGVNIAYETHPYLHVVATYDPTKRDQDIVCFIPSETLPVIVGEFGPDDDTGAMNLADCDSLVEKCEKLQIPYLAWAFNSNNSTISFNMISSNHDPQPTAWGEKMMEYLENHNSSLGVSISNFVSSPSFIYYETTENVTFSATINDRNSVGIESVKLDLSVFGEGEVDMTPNGDQYSYTYTVQSGTTPGDKEVILTVTTNGGDEITKTCTFKIAEAADDVLIIYNDSHTEITSIYEWDASATEVTENPYEGSKHYQLDGTGTTYSYCELIFDPIDFSLYETLSFASVSNGVKTRLYIIDADGNEYDEFEIAANTDPDYQVYTFPIADIEGIDVTSIRKIKFYMYRANKTGIVYLDDIKLLPPGGGTTSVVKELRSSDVPDIQIYPNPVQTELKLTSSELVNLTILDIRGTKLIARSNVMSTTFDLSALSKGVYFIRIESKSSVDVKAFVKE